MRIVLQDNRRFVLRFDKGEEVFEGLKQFLSQQAISACYFGGLGACNEIEMAFYNDHLKEYRKKPYWESFEIVSLTGNGALMAGTPVIHAHGVFARNDFTTLAGHVNKIVISATCEIFLIKLEGSMERKPDPETNLNLLV